MGVNQHSKLVNEALVVLGSKPGFVIFKNVTGVFRALNNPDKVVRVGLEGSPDLIGFCPDGKFFAGEIKTGKGVLSQVQKNFRRVAEASSVHYLEIRDLKTILDFLVKHYPQTM